MDKFKANILANYIGHFYVAFVGILVMPLYLNYLGAEAFGLVGFFTLLQSWMQFFDMGMSPTLGREVALFKNRSEKHFQLRATVRSLETVFVAIGAFIALLVFSSRSWLAESWLTLKSLDLQLVTSCIGLIAVIVGLRWLGSLYRSGINAYERQVWSSTFDIVFVTVRYPGSLLLLATYSNDLLLFFVYQAIISTVELAVVAYKFYGLLPVVPKAIPFISRVELMRIAPFALSIAYTSSVWILVSQFDKLLLSKFLPLDEYGYFTLIATVSSGIMLLSGPVSKATLPKMTSLLAAGREDEMLSIYRKSTRLVVAIVAPVTLVISSFSEEVILIWTGDKSAASWAKPILPLFVLGNGLLAIGAFQYYLQYAHGKLRQHVVYNTISGGVAVPLIAYAAFYHGPIGVGWVWLALRFISLCAWTPYVHSLLAPGIHRKWIFIDVLPGVLISLAFQFLFSSLFADKFPDSRQVGFFILLGCTVSSVGVLLSLGRLNVFNKI